MHPSNMEQVSRVKGEQQLVALSLQQLTCSGVLGSSLCECTRSQLALAHALLSTVRTVQHLNSQQQAAMGSQAKHVPAEECCTAPSVRA